jgi:hypothetical protein
MNRVVTVALLGLCLVGCGQAVGPEESADEIILHEYLAEHPEIQSNHEHWHLDTDRGIPDYGEAFLTFHRDFIGKHDLWRLEHGYPPVPAWDPTDPLAPDAYHGGRKTSDPSSVDPLCRMPDWLKLDGNGTRNPDFGAGRLADFTSSDQLGRAIDSLQEPNWHGRIHRTVGGDMDTFHNFVLDPAFWRFHKLIDQVWQQWQEATAPAAPETPPSP